MTLTDLDLKMNYRSNEDVLAQNFFKPCILESDRYDRAAGYFTSESIMHIASVLTPFLEKKGKVRLVVNPKLKEKDLEAINKGYKARVDIIEWTLLQEMKVMELQSEVQHDALNVLAWLIANEVLDMKVAFMENGGIYHEKFGVFYDEEGNRVAFIGSANETHGGYARNFEQLAVYREDEAKRIDQAEADFKNLWENDTKNLEVIDFPKVVKEKLLSYKKEYPQQKLHHAEQRAYQTEAIRQLRLNNWIGLFEMATGTGKTITSLLAATQYLREHNRMFLVVIAPYVHLADQWERELRKFDFKSITNCYGSKKAWLDEARTNMRYFNSRYKDKHVFITTYRTFASEEFQEVIQKVTSNSMLIADECHNLGSKMYHTMSFNHFDGLIGLSATPSRWWDEVGTNFVSDVFDKVVFEYSLERAIQDGKLTPYKYEPIVTSLTEKELQKYKEFTLKIVREQSRKEKDQLLIERLLQQRSLIVARAERKQELLINLLSQENIEQVLHTLVYVGPSQINEVTSQLASLGLRVHKFDSTIDRQTRKFLLERFETGEIQVLVAIKCLDEGIDVPSTRRAFFLASTSNPREFVQRRGRILRNAPNKTMAELYDFIVLPEGEDAELFTSIAKKEMPRFAEFSSCAVNSYSVRETVDIALATYNLEDLLDIKPWEAYQLTKGEA